MATQEIVPLPKVAPRRKYSLLGGNMNTKFRLFLYMGLGIMFLVSLLISPIMLFTTIMVYWRSRYYLWSKKFSFALFFISFAVFVLTAPLWAPAVTGSFAVFTAPNIGQAWFDNQVSNLLSYFVLALSGGVAYGLLWAGWDYSRTPEHRYGERKRTLLQRLWVWLQMRQMQNNTFRAEGEIVYGVDADSHSRGAVVTQGFKSVQNMMIYGNTGVGKTQTLMKIIRAAIEDKMPTFILDMKGGADLVEMCRVAAEKAGRPFYHFSFNGDWHYDMFDRRDTGKSVIDTATVQASLLIESEVWSDEHYKSLAQSYLQTVFQVIAYTGNLKRRDGSATSTLESVAMLIDPHRLRQHVRSYLNDVRYSSVQQMALRWAETIERKPESVSGLAAKLENIVNTTAAQWLAPGEKNFTMNQAWEENALVLISLNNSKNPTLSRNIGGYVVNDIKMLSGEKNGKACLFVADEFTHAGDLDALGDAVQQVRSSGFKVVLSTQAVTDISNDKKSVNEVAVNKLVGQSSTIIVHESDQITAEMFSKLAGNVWGVSTSHDTHERNSMLDVDRGSIADRGRIDDVAVPRLPADRITSMPVGHFHMIANRTVEGKRKFILFGSRKTVGKKFLYTDCYTVMEHDMAEATASAGNALVATAQSGTGMSELIHEYDSPGADPTEPGSYLAGADSERTVPLPPIPSNGSAGSGAFLGERKARTAPVAPLGGQPVRDPRRAGANGRSQISDDGYWE